MTKTHIINIHMSGEVFTYKVEVDNLPGMMEHNGTVFRKQSGSNDYYRLLAVDMNYFNPTALNQKAEKNG